MFALLLVAAVTGTSTYPPDAAYAPLPSTVTVNFGAQGKVSMPRPRPDLDVQARYTTFLSPRRDAAAVQFCWDIPAMSPVMCQVNLVRPGGQILELRGGAIGPLLWTKDGKYLIGAGNNTVRLWNLLGTLKSVTPLPSPLPANQLIHTDIQRLWLRGKDLCVAMDSILYDQRTQVSASRVTTTRYQLPAVRPLSVNSLHQKPGKEAPCLPA